jgi:excisionase family DNA binding protein
VSDDEIMTIRQVAELLKCHPATIYRLVKEHQIPGFRLGWDWRFKRSAIDEWMRDQQMKPKQWGGRRDGR